MEPSDKLERSREPHVVPLGGIFVWSMEGLILSGVYVAVVSTSQQLLGNSQSSAYGGGSTAINIVDLSFSTILLATNIMTVLLHLVIANAFNQASYAHLAGGLHAAVSNALCTVTFVCAFTYMGLYTDACLQDKETVMCAALFRTTPMPHLVAGVVSVYLLLMFLVTVALSFVSCPQDMPSFVFVSKGGLLMGVTMFCWSMPAARSVSRYGCDGINKGGGGGLLVYIIGSFLVGMVSTIMASLLQTTGKGATVMRTLNIASDVLVMIMAAVIPFSLIGSEDTGAVGMTLGVITMVPCVAWAATDVVLHAITIAGPVQLAAVDIQKAVETPKGIPVVEPAKSGGPSQASLKSDTTPPKIVTHMMDESMYASMKKADSMPRHSSSVPPSSSSMNMFFSDDVRHSLRQRAGPPASNVY